jgi:CheY-like chemotaxis protein
MTKILLVEDDKSLREIYGVRLLAEGYDIVSAGDGEEALAMAIKEKPTLIVSDVMMPKISGFDMLDILRSTTETRDIKVIMMTALSSDDQRARGEQLGADRYLVKSQVGIEDVVRTVHEVLEDAGAAGAPAPQSQPVNATAGTDTPSAATDAPAASEEPVASATPVQAESSLPQPTAPFSSPRPATLGERVINPIDSAEPTVSSAVKDQIEQELQAPVEPVTATQVDEAVSDEAAVDPATPLAAAPAPADPAPLTDDPGQEDEDEDGPAPLPPQPKLT